jgi:hypothetical protein
MIDSTKRAVARWIHLIFAIPILGYSPAPLATVPCESARGLAHSTTLRDIL